MNYLLSGYYGMRNAGDDALLYVSLSRISRLDPTAAFKVFSPIPLVLPPGAAVTTATDRWPLKTLRTLRRSDIWLFGGGGLLQDSSVRSAPTLRRFLRQARIAKAVGCRIVMLGIGVGPLNTREGQRAALGLLRCADLVTVRDEESRSLAAQLGWEGTAVVTGDLGFLLSDCASWLPKVQAGVNAGGPLGISLLSYSRTIGGSGESDVHALEAVARALNTLMRARPNLEVTLLEFFSGSAEYGDHTVLRALQRALAFPERVTYRPYDGDPLALYASIRRCRAVLGMRFHACVYAYQAMVPCLMVAYHPKSHSLAHRLGLGSDAVASGSVLAAGDELTRRLECLLDHPARFRPTVQPSTSAREADRNFALMANAMSDARMANEASASRDTPGATAHVSNVVESISGADW